MLQRSATASAVDHAPLGHDMAWSSHNGRDRPRCREPVERRRGGGRTGSASRIGGRGAMTRPLGSSYTLDEPIGRGAMGQVWRGCDRDGNVLAVKVLKPELTAEPEVLAR